MRIFGPSFEAGWIVLVIGTLGQLINCGTGSVGYLLLMSGNQKRLLKVQATMTGVMVVLNILLIPAFGILGAALAAACTAILSNAWYLREVHAALGISPYNRRYWRLLPAVTTSVILVLGLRIALVSIRPEWFAIVIGGVAGYAALAGTALVLGLDEDDRIIASAVWSRLRGSFSKWR